MSTLTRRYTDEAIGFIEQNQNKPFFVYLPNRENPLKQVPGGLYLFFFSASKLRSMTSTALAICLSSPSAVDWGSFLTR